LGLFAGLGCAGMNYFYKQLQSLKEKKKKILHQGSPHTPKTLMKLKDSLSTQPEFMMLSGVCVRGTEMGKIFESQIDERAMLTYVRNDSKVYKIVYKQNLDNTKHRVPQWKQSIPVVSDFQMIDPSDPEKVLIQVIPGS
jgi:hypothetical protein